MYDNVAAFNKSSECLNIFYILTPTDFYFYFFLTLSSSYSWGTDKDFRSDLDVGLMAEQSLTSHNCLVELLDLTYLVKLVTWTYVYQVKPPKKRSELAIWAQS